MYPGRLVRAPSPDSSCSALFDIIKPYPANRFEHLHGGVGVMADDAMAAVYANLALAPGDDRCARGVWIGCRMKAWIVAVGSELLTPFRVDTNSLAITERLNAIGCDVRFKAVVGDDVDELARRASSAASALSI